jgi:hypothetical protein
MELGKMLDVGDEKKTNRLNFEFSPCQGFFLFQNYV